MINRLFILLALLALLLLAGCSNKGATITWKTASEVETAGFNLYRSTSPDGPWEKINAQIIPPAEDPVSGGDYSFIDKTAKPGQTYYYQLEEVELSGGSNRFDPIKLDTSMGPLSWPWWGVGALFAIGLGWILGSRFRKKPSP